MRLTGCAGRAAAGGQQARVQALACRAARRQTAHPAPCVGGLWSHDPGRGPIPGEGTPLACCSARVWRARTSAEAKLACRAKRAARLRQQLQRAHQRRTQVRSAFESWRASAVLSPSLTAGPTRAGPEVACAGAGAHARGSGATGAAGMTGRPRTVRSPRPHHTHTPQTTLGCRALQAEQHSMALELAYAGCPVPLSF